MRNAFRYFPLPNHWALFRVKVITSHLLETIRNKDTRWVCRYKNVASLKKSFLPLLKVLTELSQPSSRKFIEAAGLLNVLKSARFCICLIIFHDVLRTIHVVHKSLQASDITLFSAKTCVKNMIHVFKTMRTGAKCDEMWEKIKEFSESAGIVVCESKFMLF